MKNRIRFTDVVLILLGVGTILFVVETFNVFALVGAEPSSLVTGYFAFATAEAGILWRIYESKHKRKRKEETMPDEADLDIEADPNETEEDSIGGEG